LIHTEELLSLFEQYYRDPHQVWPDLFYGLTHYSFDNYFRLIDEALKMTPSLTLVTSQPQKTNSGSQYYFAPTIVKSDVEVYLRYRRPYDELLYIEDSLWRKDFSSEFEDNSMYYKKPIHCLYLDDLWANAGLVNLFVEKYATGKTYIFGRPNSLWQLMDNEEFLARSHRMLHGFVNVDCPAFADAGFSSKYGCEFNDQMIDWKSGLNFYTCLKGHKHFIPIFVERRGCFINLLNSDRFSVNAADEFIVNTPFELCECGSYRCGFKFRSHIHNMPKNIDYDRVLRLRSELVSKYRTIQFVENKNCIEVFYLVSNDEEMDKADVHLINEVFDEPKFNKGRYFQLGRKLYYIWSHRSGGQQRIKMI